MKTELIDRIYEASFIPEMWSGILDDLGEMTDSEGGLLFSDRDKVLSWTASDTLKPAFSSYLQDGWFARCDRRVCMAMKAHSEFMRETDYWTAEEIDSNEIYANFFRPRGLGWSAGTGLILPTEDKIVLSVERKHDEGPIEDKFVNLLNDMRPHLARSAMIAARLGLQSAKGASDAMSLLGMPTFLFNAKGEVLDSHNMTPEIDDFIVQRAQGKIAFKDKDADTIFWSSLKTVNMPDAPEVRSFPIKDDLQNAALVGHVIPISRGVNDLFARSFAMLVLTPITKSNMPPVELLRSLFDLTGTEARVARHLAGGKSVDEIAEKNGVAVSTVRSHLKKIMEKTGCSRQAEIVALMAGVNLKRE